VPEGLEAELYRRAAERALGRTIEQVAVDDRQPWSREIESALAGAPFTAARRIGKRVYLDLGGRATADTLSLHFGMTGRLVVDDRAPIEALEYSSGRDDRAWDRLVVRFEDGGILRVNDPRRWARFELDPGTDRLGPEFLEVSTAHLTDALGRRRAAVKTVLLDQSVVAGYGNMSVDEVLWQVGVSPLAPARELPVRVVERLVGTARPHLLEMLEHGGSHRGTIDPEIRADVSPCPRDGAPRRRDRVGGRTTIWCPAHQLTAPNV